MTSSAQPSRPVITRNARSARATAASVRAPLRRVRTRTRSQHSGSGDGCRFLQGVAWSLHNSPACSAGKPGATLEGFRYTEAMRCVSVALACLGVLAGCDAASSLPGGDALADASPIADGGVPVRGMPEAGGSPDVEPMDAGSRDSGSPDAGPRTGHRDGASGTADDGSTEDAGSEDTGRADASSDAGPTPVVPNRIVFIHTPHGLSDESWRPTGGRRDFVLSEVLSPFESLRDKTIVLAGLDLAHEAGFSGNTTHHFGPPTLLTGDTGPELEPEGYNGGGQSLDQTIAASLSITAFRSLELGVQNGTQLPRHEISFREVGQPLLRENDPSDAFTRVFGGLAMSHPSVDMLRSLVQAPLDPYANDAFPEVTRRQLALLTTALSLELTHVASLRFTNEGPATVFTWLGQSETWHSLAHAAGAPAAAEQLDAIWSWFASTLATWAGELDTVATADGLSLLDHTVIVWISDTGVPQAHSSTDIPVLIVGGAAAGLDTGQFLEVDRLHVDLLVSLGQAMGLPLTTFGDPAFEATPIEELSVP